MYLRSFFTLLSFCSIGIIFHTTLTCDVEAFSFVPQSPTTLATSNYYRQISNNNNVKSSASSSASSSSSLYMKTSNSHSSLFPSPLKRNTIQQQFSTFSPNNLVSTSIATSTSTSTSALMTKNEENGDDTDENRSMIYKIYKFTIGRLWNTWFFRLLKKIISTIFNLNGKDDDNKNEKITDVNVNVAQMEIVEKEEEEIATTVEPELPVVEKDDEKKESEPVIPTTTTDAVTTTDTTTATTVSSVKEEIKEEKEEEVVAPVVVVEEKEEEKVVKEPIIIAEEVKEKNPEPVLVIEEVVKEVVQEIEEDVQVVVNEVVSEESKTEKVVEETEEIEMKQEEEVVSEVEQPPVEEPQTKELPKGQRWAIASPDVNLSANWKIVVTDQFKEEYDQYLKSLGQPSLVRSIAVSIVELTTEEVIQSDMGRSVCIKGKNLRGVWERTLLSSGSDYESEFNESDEEHDQIELVTADKEKVQAEAWWESSGTVHRSYLRGVKKYGGGDFESKRYLEDDGNTLVCESLFHPKNGKEPATIKWTFSKVA